MAFSETPFSNANQIHDFLSQATFSLDRSKSVARCKLLLDVSVDKKNWKKCDILAGVTEACFI